MSFQNGMAALRMEMPGKVPRTEYSVEGHWELIRTVTGMDVTTESTWDVKAAAQKAFMKAWDYSFRWNILIHGSAVSHGRHTQMGHAEYSSGGGDFSNTVYCPFQTPEEALAFDPVEEYGILPHKEMVRRFEEQYRQSCEYYGDAVNMSGIYITLFSGLIEIFGWEMMLTACGTDPEGFGKVAQRYEQWIKPFFDAYADADIPVMMVHDDIVWTSGPVFHPDWYRKYIFPAYQRLWAPVLESGKRLVYTSDGTYSMFFDDIVKAGAHSLVMEPTSDMAAFAEKYGKTHGFIGNVDTRILLSGSKADIRAEVKRCMDIGKKCPGFILAVGNHIPANTPVENALYYNQVYEELAYR